jgi:hypothetical protein
LKTGGKATRLFTKWAEKSSQSMMGYHPGFQIRNSMITSRNYSI